jgi:eukaryotic-like serine/threonine-protein kinase
MKFPPRLKISLTPGEAALTRRALSLLGFFSFLTIATALGSMFYTRLHQPMIVPAVIGMSRDQAQKALSSKGLDLRVTRIQYDEHVPAGLVSEQRPRANDYVKRGQTVDVVISKGNPMVKVPPLAGMSFPQAQIALDGVHLRVGRESVMTSLDTRDTVLAQVPPPGEQVDSFTDVDLLVSGGPEDPAFVMPNLQNQPLETAFKLLRPVGITIEKIKTEVHDDLNPETILSQTPPPGTKIERKDGISLVISAKSTEAALQARYLKISYDMPPGNPRRLQIDVFDSSGTRTLYNKMESPGDHVELGVSVTGRASAQIYLNQEFVKEIPIE